LATITELHPEGLLARASTGELSPHDADVLRRHLEDCPACSLQLAISRSTAPQARDAELIERVASRATHAWSPARGPAKRSRVRLGFLAAALCAAAAAAAVPAWDFRGSSQPTPTVGRALSALPPVVRAPVPTGPTDPPALPDSEPAVLPAPAHASGAASEPKTPSVRPLSAQELLERAASERRAGRTSIAVLLYRELQRTYPRSREAHVSRVSLGRLLAASGNPAGALHEFDAYLGSSGSATLTEEALVGRATALEKLGRMSEAQAAWQHLVDRYPGSLSAARARERLAASRSTNAR